MSKLSDRHMRFSSHVRNMADIQPDATLLRDSVRASPLSGRHALIGLELADKAGRVNVAYLRHNVLDGHVGFRQQPLGLVKAHQRHVLGEGAARFLLEKAAQDPEIGIVLINRTLASLCSEEIGAFRKSHSLPAVTEIPDRSSDGSGNSIADYVSEAIGIKI